MSIMKTFEAHKETDGDREKFNEYELPSIYRDVMSGGIGWATILATVLALLAGVDVGLIAMIRSHQDAVRAEAISRNPDVVIVGPEPMQIATTIFAYVALLFHISGSIIASMIAALFGTYAEICWKKAISYEPVKTHAMNFLDLPCSWFILTTATGAICCVLGTTCFTGPAIHILRGAYSSLRCFDGIILFDYALYELRYSPYSQAPIVWRSHLPSSNYLT
ncbi:hypothetical protein CPB86DRAFT_878604 [Serendipita vermifera]|nr:hypothetical protein CPB86DRAFT_878604 [Serendipita vermifera]